MFEGKDAGGDNKVAMLRAGREGGGGVTGGVPPPPTSGIIDRHFGELSDLHSRLCRLNTRLVQLADTFLGCEPKDPNSRVEPAPSTHEAKLQAATNYLHAQVSQLEDQVARLERL